MSCANTNLKIWMYSLRRVVTPPASPSAFFPIPFSIRGIHDDLLSFNMFSKLYKNVMNDTILSCQIFPGLFIYLFLFYLFIFIFIFFFFLDDNFVIRFLKAEAVHKFGMN